MPMMLVEVTHCLDCDREFGVEVAYDGAGKCNRCRTGRVVTQKPLEVVVEEYRFMRDNGVFTRDIPKRLGMTDGAFSKAMYRARAMGDDRVADFHGMSGIPNRDGRSRSAIRRAQAKAANQ